MSKHPIASVFYTIICLLVGMFAIELWLRSDQIAYAKLAYTAIDPPIYAPSPTMPYTLAKNIHAFQYRRGEYLNLVHTNEQGLREDRLIEVPKPDGVYRILTIGDSYVFGYGANREDLFQTIAEKQLARLHPDKKIEIVNMGFAAAGSLDARYIYMRDVAINFQPDLVLFNFNYGADTGRLVENLPYSQYDSAGLPITANFHPVAIDPVRHARTDRLSFETELAGRIFLPNLFSLPSAVLVPAPQPLSQTIRLAWNAIFTGDFADACNRIRLCIVVQKYLELRRLKDEKTGFDQFNVQLLPAQPYSLISVYTDVDLQNEEGLREGGDLDIGWRMSKRIFLGARDFLRERGVDFGVLMIPKPFLVDYDPAAGEDQVSARFYKSDEIKIAQEQDKPSRVFGGFFDRSGIPFIHPMKAMHEDRLKVDAKLYYPFDEHLNPQGHVSFGKHMANWIEKQNWIAD